MRALFSVALVGLFAGSAVAADEPPVKPAFECRWLTGPITIDGVADEDAWKNAQVIDKFSLPWLKDKARPARTATRARLLWDSENFYFFADMDDADLYADITERDGQTWSNDVFEVFFKPHTDKPGYYEFQVNAAGTEMDMYLPKRGTGGYQRYKGDTEFHLKTAVKLRGTLNKWSDKDEGWSVEGQIPWRDFGKTGGKPEIGVTWGLALCRYDYSVDFEGPDLSTCAQCHKMYGEGQEVGPDITANGRTDFEQLLSNVFDPSLVIGAGYHATTVVTAGGQSLSGLVVEDSPQRIVLKTQGGKLETIARGDVDQVIASKVSYMPEDVEKQLRPQEIADLFAFLTLDRPPADPKARKIPGTPR